MGQIMPTSLNPFHLSRLIQKQIAERPNEPVLQYQHQAQWRTLTWSELAKQVNQLACSLLELGVGIQDRIGIFSANSLAWVQTDLALLQLRAVSVPIYSTNTEEQTGYIVNDAGISILFVGDQEQYHKALAVAADCPTLTTVVAMSDAIEVDPAATSLKVLTLSELFTDAHLQHLNTLRTLQQNPELEELFTLIYTSGTTGEPKGVMLNHRNFAALVQQHQLVVPVKPGTLSLSFLPLSHVYERGWSLYILCCGGCNAYLNDPAAVQQALVEVKPEVMCAVPRLFEKVHGAVMGKVQSAPWHKRLIFAWSLRQGRRQFQADQAGRKRASISAWYLRLADKLVLSKLREALGGNLKFMSAGGARLDDKVNAFFQHIGIPVLAGYGATETTATATCNRLDRIATSGVGLPLPDLQLRIGENDEVLVKADTVMAGYYNRPEDTKAAFVDGWYKTGDAGYLDNDGFLHITDRIKELMKTSNGKYIAPQRVEGVVTLEPMVEQVAIIADSRNFVSALIVPNFELLTEWATAQGLSFGSDHELVSLPEAQAEIQQRIDALQTDLARYERVKQICLLPRPFSMDKGELTPTLKLRRKVISEVFAKEIEAMYHRKH
ncbi:long-chain fatty acid--CoA ligase [Ferrimonas sp. SCSIO 43195]|nr:long-chain fatty acid--CoA ligase [Ferrimonas sp. SCSIO 43195]